MKNKYMGENMKVIKYIIIIIIFTITTYSQNPEWIIYNTSNSDIFDNVVISLAIDSSNNKWIGGIYSRVNQFKNNSWFYYGISQKLVDIYSIEVDKLGNIWVGHYDGLSKYDGNDWTHYTPYNSSMPAQIITSIAFDNEGNKWLGTDGCDLLIFNDSNWTIKDVGSKIGNEMGEIFAILLLDSSKIYVGTGSDISDESIGIVGKYEDNKWSSFWPEKSGMTYANMIHKIVMDSYGVIWIAASSLGFDSQIMGGLVKFKDIPGDTAWTVYQTSNSGIPNNNVYALAIDENNLKWVGTKEGLAKFNDTTWTTWNTENSDLPSNQINCIVIDKYDNKWIGTDNGLAVFREGGVIINVEDEPKNEDYTIHCSPNPIHGSANIQYYLPEYSHIIIKVFDIYANTIEVLKDEYKERGIYNIDFNTAALPAGIYFYQLQTQSGTITKKMIVLQ
jgi:ligand-binding sensor domain-containing protein